MTRPDSIKIAIVGLGKIARDQHVPSLAADSDFDLIGVASPHGQLAGVPNYPDIETLLQAVPEIQAVALCTTPQVRYHAARHALERGLHVLLEKPPGVSVSEVLALVELAKQTNTALFASWHSRHAGGVEPARAWLASRKISSARITWKEDIRIWHPGQAWIWEAGGLGVFDPGINAFSILTKISPDRVAVQDAELLIPDNCQTPIAARLVLSVGRHSIQVELDFRHPGQHIRDIDIDTDAGPLKLSEGGTTLTVADKTIESGSNGEYQSVYAHFAQLVRERLIDVDVAPLQLVADAFLCARRIQIEPFVH